MVTNFFTAPTVHGKNGPVHLTSRSVKPGSDYWLAAGQSLGIPHIDPSGPQNVSKYKYTIWKFPVSIIFLLLLISLTVVQIPYYSSFNRCEWACFYENIWQTTKCLWCICQVRWLFSKFDRKDWCCCQASKQRWQTTTILKF